MTRRDTSAAGILSPGARASTVVGIGGRASPVRMLFMVRARPSVVRFYRIAGRKKPDTARRACGRRVLTVAGQILIGKTGRITEGSRYVGRYLRVEPSSGRDVGFLIITSTQRDFVCREAEDEMWDDWVLDEPSLHQYFAETGYVVEWLD